VVDGVRTAVAVSLGALVVLLALLWAGAGLGALGWGVGLGCGVVVTVAVARGVRLAGADRLGPADRVTLTRAILACAVAALATESSPRHTVLLVVTASVALALDAVDGRVARATRTQSGFGARFDGEADAFLMLVLSVHVASDHGAWVLAIGVARYAFWLAGLPFPWLRGPLPARPWRKVVAAVQGVVLVVAAAGVLPIGPASALLAVALGLLAESFGRDVLWLVRHGRPRSSVPPSHRTPQPAP
jgi:phosphatidylglycerophosphate synthase